MTVLVTVKAYPSVSTKYGEAVCVAGWVVADYADADFAAGPGVAIREFMTPNGPMDYLLVAERKVVSSLESKKEGETLRQVEAQADRYADGFETLVKTKNRLSDDDRATVRVNARSA
jgi:type I site-specific restriction endonuclease